MTDPAVLAALAEMEIDPQSLAFLGCRCLEEEAAREQRQRVYANLPTREPAGTFETFEARPGAEEAREAAAGFAEGRGPDLLVLVGKTGCGKSHLLEAIGRELVACRDYSVKYEYAADLLTKLRETFNHQRRMQQEGEGDFTFADLLASYQRAPVLLLDDLGLRDDPTPWEREQMTALVDERLRNGRRLAVATNLTEAQMRDRMGPRLASRLFDVYSGAVRLVTMVSGDYRTGE